jgi:hypothetical protein
VASSAPAVRERTTEPRGSSGAPGDRGGRAIRSAGIVAPWKTSRGDRVHDEFEPDKMDREEHDWHGKERR